MKKAISFALSCLAAFAVKKEDITVKLEGEQNEHTADEFGNFKHPFLNQPSHIETIEYPDDGVISVKVKQIKRQGKRPRSAKTLSNWESMKESLQVILGLGQQTRIRSGELVNYDNLLYIGKLYMGENMEPVDINFDTGSYYYFCKV